MNAPAFSREPLERKTVLTGVERVAIYSTMTDRLRNARAAQIVEGMDPDMQLRIIRAAMSGLSGYGGHDMIADGCDAIEADMIAEDARQIGGGR